MSESFLSRQGSDAPLVTAVLVCWNHERYVRAAVLSVLTQTYPNIELIVFENGSTDGSRRELEALRREYPFQLVCQDNVGLVKALNVGLSMARGKYFALLSTDDVWLPGKTAFQVRYLEEHPDVHMVSGQVDTIDANGAPIDLPITRRPGEVTFSDLMRNGCNVAGPTVMCRTDTLRRMGGYDEKVQIEDYAMALRFTHEGCRVVNLAETVCLYRRHGSNWTSRPIWKERIEVGQRYRSTDEYKAFARHNLAGYFRWLAGRNKREALKLLRTEPIAWSWNDVGIGMLKLLTPQALLRSRRTKKGR